MGGLLHGPVGLVLTWCPISNHAQRPPSSEEGFCCGVADSRACEASGSLEAFN